MKLYTMAKTEDDVVGFGGTLFIKGTHEYFVKLETEDEERLYNYTHDSTLDGLSQTYNEGYWDCAMYSLLGVTESDVYFYLMPLDETLEVHDKYVDADGIEWERVK